MENQLLLEDKSFYTYIYLDPRKMGTFIYGDYCFGFEPFYVGKGCRNRKDDHLKNAKNENIKINNRKLNKIRKILKSGYLPIIITVKNNLNNHDALLLEEYLGKQIKLIEDGGTLTNARYPCAASGGNGRFSQESKLKLSRMKRNNPEKTKQTVLKFKKTVKEHPEIWKESGKKISKIRKEKGIASGVNNPMYNNGFKIKGSKNGMYNKNHKEESRKKMSETKKEHGVAKGENNSRWITVDFELLQSLCNENLYLYQITEKYNEIKQTKLGTRLIAKKLKIINMHDKIPKKTRTTN